MAAAWPPHDAREEGPWSAWRDEDLLLEYTRKGSGDAFAELVHRYQRPLYIHLRRYLGDAGLVEDALQATFLAVHLRRGQFDPRRRFRPWVYCIATTRAIDLYRRNRQPGGHSPGARRQGRSADAKGWSLEDLPDARAVPPLEQLEAGEDRQKLWRVVDALPPHLREVLVLIVFRGAAYQEAADTLEIPLGTVKSRMHEALRRLRETPRTTPDAPLSKGSKAP
jgi:RNA polymerase sigma-70 factor (ECF subfamily)